MKRALIAAGVAGLIPALTLPAYFSEMKRARLRLQQFGSQLMNTDYGPVEYATAGEGESVMVVHGAATGYFQGISAGQDILGEGYHIIAPSRFGYQRTPLPKDASPAAQADALASLLDALSITRIPVVATSAGALSCMQLALRHPERVSSLVLLVPGLYGPKAAKNPRVISAGFILGTLFQSNYPVWVAAKLNPGKVLFTMGVPPALQPQLTPEQKVELLNWILPYDDRIAGLINDGRHANNLEPLPLHNVQAPTLIVSAKDDPWNTYGPAQYTTAHLFNASFIGYETGGHFLIGHEKEIRSEVRSFLVRHTLEPAIKA